VPRGLPVAQRRPSSPCCGSGRWKPSRDFYYRPISRCLHRQANPPLRHGPPGCRTKPGSSARGCEFYCGLRRRCEAGGEGSGRRRGASAGAQGRLHGAQVPQSQVHVHFEHSCASTCPSSSPTSPRCSSWTTTSWCRRTSRRSGRYAPGLLCPTLAPLVDPRTRTFSIGVFCTVK